MLERPVAMFVQQECTLLPGEEVVLHAASGHFRLRVVPDHAPHAPLAPFKEGQGKRSARAAGRAPTPLATATVAV